MFLVIRSIAIYLGVFGFSYLLFLMTEQQLLHCECNSSSRGRRNVLRIFCQNIWAIAAILLLALLAGLRADSVGVDVTVYPGPFLQSAAGYTSFLDFLGDPALQPIHEPLHALVVWLCSRVTVEKGLLLFFYQLLTVSPVYWALYQLRDRMPISIGMAVYMLFFYNNSLNMMRQSVSCAFLLLAFSYLLTREGRPSWKTFVFALVAVLFHRSGIIGLFLLLCVSLLGRTRRKNIRVAVYIFIALTPLLLVGISTMFTPEEFGDSHFEYYYKVFITKEQDVDFFINPLRPNSVAYLIMYAWLVFLPQLLPRLLDWGAKISEVHGMEMPLPFNHTLNNGKHFAKPEWAISQSGRFQDDGKRSSETHGSQAWLADYLHVFNLVGFIIYVAILFSFQTVYGSRISLYLDFFLIFSISLACTGNNAQIRRCIVIFSLVCIWLVWIIRLGWSGSQTYLFFFE